MSEPVVRVEAMDHVVLNVADTRRAVEWYGGVLGLEVLRFDEWERHEVFFPSVRVDAHTIIDLLETPRTGSNVDHLCLVVDPATDLDALAASGAFEVLDGPDDRWGARGMGRSLYVRDPDHNVVELRTYPAAAAEA
jgi:catechol 2,3-dioxygenase-like lactoylglutathione lyase family enzyme